MVFRVLGKYHQLISRIQTHKRLKRMLVYYDVDNTVQIFWEIPFCRPQNDTVKRLKTMKNDRGEVTYLFCCCCVQCLPAVRISQKLHFSRQNSSLKKKKIKKNCREKPQRMHFLSILTDRVRRPSAPVRVAPLYQMCRRVAYLHVAFPRHIASIMLGFCVNFSNSL